MTVSQQSENFLAESDFLKESTVKGPFGGLHRFSDLVHVPIESCQNFVLTLILMRLDPSDLYIARRDIFQQTAEKRARSQTVGHLASKAKTVQRALPTCCGSKWNRIEWTRQQPKGTGARLVVIDS